MSFGKMNRAEVDYTSDRHFDFDFKVDDSTERIMSVTDSGIDFYKVESGRPIKIWGMIGA